MTADDSLDRALLAQEIGGQHLDRGSGRSTADRSDRARKMAGSAIIEIVAVDRSHDDMGQPEGCNRLGNALGLLRVEQVGPAGRDVAEGAGARADAARPRVSQAGCWRGTWYMGQGGSI